MRIVFAGTPVFAARALQALHAAGHDIALVLTQPDRPAGRGNKVVASPVKQLALELGLPVAQPPTLRDAAAQDMLRAVGAELMVVAAYGLILPQAVLDIPPRGCLNIHASLLPRWRGAAPIQRAIEAGDTLTGITLMRMEAGLDTGPMLLKAETPILDDDTGGSLHDRLAVMGAELVVRGLAAAHLEETPQPEDGVTYARKLDRAEGRLDWREPAEVLARRVRAFDPVPGCTLQPAEGEPVKVWAAHADTAPTGAEPGTVRVADPALGLQVACGEGSLWLDELQKPGGRRLPARAVLQGWSLPVGSVLRLPD